MGLFYVGTMWFTLAMLLWAERFFTKNETYTAGITIPAEHRQDACVQDVLKDHKKRRMRMLLCMAITAFVCLIPGYDFVDVLWLTVWLTVMLVWDYFLVRTTIRKMYEVKKANGWQKKPAQTGVVLVDTRVSGMKDKMPVSSMLFAIPICCLVSYILWWLLYGESDKVALVMLLCAFGTVVLGIFLYRSIVHTKLRVYSEDSNVNLAINRMTKRVWTGCVLWETSLLVMYSVASGLYFYYSLQKGMAFFWVLSILISGLTIIPMVCVCMYLSSMKKNLLQGKPLAEPVEDEDEYWLDGLYRNPYDNSSFVETRVGIGVSVNMAKPSMRWFTYGSLIFALVLCLGSTALVAVLELSDIQVEKQETMLEVTGGIFSEQIAYEEMESVEWYTELPKMMRTWGSATKQYLIGEFRLEEFGGANVFVKKSVDGYILITCKDAPYLLFNCETEEETKEIYAWLLEKQEQ